MRSSISAVVLAGIMMLAIPLVASADTFASGAQVTTAANLNVRQSANINSKLLCVQNLGASGAITGGPTVQGGYTWWQVNFDTGCDGWVVQIYLALGSVLGASTSLSNAGVCGPANNVPVGSAPSSNLCSVGSASAVTGAGPFNWSCSGSNGGATPSCSAPPTLPISSVLNYGALVGSCSYSPAITANNQAIQAALNSGQSIYFPPGNYPFTALGFKIAKSGQHLFGAACTGTGTASPSCPSSIQDCTAPLTMVTNEVVATGNGTTGPYTATLAHGVNPGSDIITIPGNANGNDDTSTGANDGHLIGGCASGFLDWTTGAITCTTVNPVPSGQQITVSYQWSTFQTQCNGTTDLCGYFTVQAPNVEIDNLLIQGNQPAVPTGLASVQTATHKGIYGNGAGNDNLYVHDLYLTKVSGEAIYSDASGPNTRFIHTTITNSPKVGLNTNNGLMTNVQITDNMVINVAGCILVAANDAYVLRNTCQGGSFPGGSDAITLWPVGSFHVVAYNTINQWNSSDTATSPLVIAASGPGVVAYNTITRNLQYGIRGQGAAIAIGNGYGPEVVAFNKITNNGVTGTANPGILIGGSGTGPILISNNALNGTAQDENIGIEVYSNVPTGNQIQINTSNTFGTIPTPTQFLVAPSGAPVREFQAVIQKALPYFPRGLNISN
jgi:hypothetical protein